MIPPSNLEFDVAVVGAGPAGIAAAVTAADGGARVALLDDNPAPGGQIWRRGDAPSGAAQRWFTRLSHSTVVHLPGSRVFDQPRSGVICAERGEDRVELRYGKLILATGARELFLPFPGWTLPNVFGAGGLDAMARSGLPVAGKRVVIAGTGPLLLAVAAHLAARGANIIAVCEQAPARAMASFAAQLLAQPGKLVQGANYRWATRRSPLHFGCWPVGAHGTAALESVTLRQHGREWNVACDFLACGFHLVPNTELAQLIGCRIEDGFVAVDDLQQTSVENVFCAGEPTSIGGVDLALIEGQIAGFAAAGAPHEASQLIRRRRRMLPFVRALRSACTLNPELRSLADHDTVVCRCEDVPYGALYFWSWREAKLQTRCGMGPCQGRICGAAAQFLFGWKVDGVRPPVFPALVSSLVTPDAIPEEVP